jgi:predicted phosphate transport protein (TIGR00153 family)
MSSLFEWFKSRNEESAINKTLVHMQKVLECVVEFEKGLSFLIEEKNIDLALKVFFRVNELEHQADGIRRNILNMLSKAELTPTIRENLTHLVKRIDDVANAANASARILIYMNQADFLKLDNEVHKKILEMVGLSVEAVKKLNIMVHKLLDGKEEETQKLGEEVNTLEHKCDEIHFAINRILVSNNPNINPFSAIEIHNCISELENISDNAEEVADYIIMLTISKRT